MKSFYKALLIKGKSVQWLADKLGVSHQAVQHWKSGKTKPRPKNLVKMAKILELDIEKLVKEYY